MALITSYKPENKVIEEIVIEKTYSFEDILKGDFGTVDNTIHEVPSKKYRSTITRDVPNIRLTHQHRMGSLPAPNPEEIIVFMRNVSLSFMSNEDMASCYDIFRLPKRSGGFRTIKAPKPELKEAQRKIADMFSFKLKMLSHESAFAYVQKRSVADAIRVHQVNGSNWFLKIDMKNFFDNCTPEFIQTQLRNLWPLSHWSEDTYNEFITILTKMACLDNGLPQGTPLSPILTNLIMVAFDKWATEFSYAHALRYTRYADDLLFSSKYNFKYRIVEKEVNNFLESNNYPFKVNLEKTRYGNNKGSNFNLGLMLNKDNNITIGYKNKRELKSMLYHLHQFKDTWTSVDVEQLRGKLEWLRSNEPEYHANMIQWFNKKHQTDVYRDLLK